MKLLQCISCLVGLSFATVTFANEQHLKKDEFHMHVEAGGRSGVTVADVESGQYALRCQTERTYVYAPIHSGTIELFDAHSDKKIFTFTPDTRQPVAIPYEVGVSDKNISVYAHSSDDLRLDLVFKSGDLVCQFQKGQRKGA